MHSLHTFSDDVVAGPGKDASDQGLAISQASKQAASQESSHAESISQLQQQAIELSTAAGVPVESLSSQASLSARLVKGPESKQQALNKLTQLQAMAQQHAAKLQVAFVHQPFIVRAIALADEAVVMSHTTFVSVARACSTCLSGLLLVCTCDVSHQG